MNNVHANIEHYGLDARVQASAMISGTLDAFAKTLPPHELEPFQALNIGDQIDKTCWELARPEYQGGNPNNLNRAINLRARHAQYSLEQYMQEPQGRPTWDYLMPVYENSFWQAVDKSFMSFIIKLAQDNYKQYVTYPDIDPPSAAEQSRTVSICNLEIQDDQRMLIAKHLQFAACTKIVTVTYLAEPYQA